MGHSKRLACSIHDAPSGEFFDTFQCVANSTSPLNPWLQPRTGLQERQAGPDLWPCMSPCQLRFPRQFLPRNLAGIQSKSTPSLQEVGRRVIETLLGDSLCKFSDNGTGDTDCKEGERGPHDPSAHGCDPGSVPGTCKHRMQTLSPVTTGITDTRCPPSSFRSSRVRGKAGGPCQVEESFSTNSVTSPERSRGQASSAISESQLFVPSGQLSLPLSDGLGGAPRSGEEALACGRILPRAAPS